MILRNYNKRKYIIFLFCCIFLLNLCVACAAFSPKLDIRKRAYITDKNTSWKIIHVNRLNEFEDDILTNSEISIWLSFFDGDDGQHFETFSTFDKVNGNITFNPTEVTVKLHDRDLIKARGMKCDTSYVKSSSSVMRNSPIVDKWISVNEGACFFHFFDYPPPPLEEEIVMNFNNAIKLNGKNFEVPPIYFRKTVNKIYRLGFIP